MDAHPRRGGELSRAVAPALLNKREIADWLGVCPRTIDNWLLEGWLPVIQPSARIQRFNPARVLAAMEELFGKGHGYQGPYRRPDSIHSL